MKFDINKKNRGEIAKALSLMTQLGLTMAVCVAIGVIAGRFLDEKIGSSPWFLMGFSILGVLSAIKFMYDSVIKDIKSDDKQYERDKIDSVANNIVGRQDDKNDRNIRHG